MPAYLIYTLVLCFIFILDLGAAGVIYYTIRTNRATVYLSLILILFAQITLMFLAMLWAANEEVGLIYAKLRFLGLAFCGPLFLSFALEHTGRSVWLRFPFGLLLFVIPVITQIVLWTPPLTHLFLAEWTLIPHPPVQSESLAYGPWFYVHAVYNGVVILIGNLVLIHRFWHQERQRLWALGFTVYAFIALVILMIPGGALPGYPEIRITPFALTAAVIIWLYVIFQRMWMIRLPIAYDTIFTSLNDILIVLDNEDRVSHANPAAVAFMKAKESDYLGKSVVNLIPALIGNLQPNPDQPTTTLTMRCGERQEICTFSLQVADLKRGTSRIGRVIVLRDETRERAMQAALKANEQFFRAIYDGVQTLIFSVDVDETGTFRISGINPAHERANGLRNADVIGKQLAEIEEMPPEAVAEFTMQFSRCLKVGNSITFDKSAEIEGKTRWWTTQLNPLRNEQGRIDRIIGMSFEVTAEREAADRAREVSLEKERSQILANFIRDASHEFGTPVATIKTGLYVMSRQTDPEKNRERIAALNREADRISELVNDLQTMVKLDGIAPNAQQPVEVNRIVKDICDRHRHSSLGDHLVMELRLSKRDLLVKGDPIELARAVFEVLDNATRFTPAGGMITVETSESEQRARIVVRDSGVGMDEETRQQAFDRFFRRDSAHSTAGFGLGLAIARRIVERHGGEITLDSIVGFGTTVVIALPLASQAG